MAAPLLIPVVVTTAVRLPPASGWVVKFTVSAVADAEVTTPSAPLLKVTVFREAVELNPLPLMVTDVASAARSAVLTVTTGVTVAT